MGRKAENLADLSDDFARAAICPAGKRYVMWQDKDTKCFAIRIMATGEKFWVMNSRAHGQRSLGSCSELKASKARVLAEEKLLEVMNGKETTISTTKPTLRIVLDLYVRAKNIGTKTQKGMLDTLKIYGAKIIDLPMKDVTQELAVDAVEVAWERSLRQGDLFKQYAHSLYRYRKMDSPFEGIKARWKSGAAPFALPVDKIGEFLDAMDEIRVVTTRDILWTSLLTGFRPDAVVSMRWEHLRLTPGDAAYYISEGAPGFKDGQTWWYPLPEYLAERLRTRERRHKYGEWVFHNSSDSDKHVRGFRDAVLTLRQSAGIPELQPYHLRDTRATLCERFFGQTIVTQRILNHRPDYIPTEWIIDGRKVKTSESTHRYVKTHEHEIRDFVERYCDIILELGGRKPLTDIVRDVLVLKKAIAVRERYLPAPMPAEAA
jgi:integrase